MTRQILLLSHADVTRLLTPDRCIAAVRDALTCLAAGDAHLPLRTVMRPPQLRGLLGLMPAYLGGAAPAFGFKAVSVFAHDDAPGRPAQQTHDRDAHQGVVTLLDPESGEPLALLDASAITALRTAAASAVATDVLAPKGACDLAIIGAGVQARAHLVTLPRVRAIKRARIAARRLAHAERLAGEMAAALGIPVTACRDAAEAVRGAEIIVTATTSATPVLPFDAIAPGAHINAVGACLPAARELDAATMKAARVFTDRRESLLAEAGDYLLAAQEGAIGPGDVAGEIGEVLLGKTRGRGREDEITIFKSLGIAVEDLAAARAAYDAAKASGVGTWVAF